MRFFTAVCVAGYTLVSLAGAVPHNNKRGDDEERREGNGNGNGNGKGNDRGGNNRDGDNKDGKNKNGKNRDGRFRTTTKTVTVTATAGTNSTSYSRSSSSGSTSAYYTTATAAAAGNFTSPFGNFTAPFGNATIAANGTAFANGTLLTNGTAFGNNTVMTVTVTVTATPSSSSSTRTKTKSSSSSRRKKSSSSKIREFAYETFSKRSSSVVSSSAAAVPVLPSAYPASSAAPPSPPGPTASAPAGTGKVKYGGVNIAGFDFGCTIDGTCTTGGNLDVVSNGNAIQQMQHFVNDDGLNTFRLPVGWQYLVNNQLGGPLDTTNFAAYDRLVQGCVSSGAAACIIDVHNYARWNGQIIGQGGPTNDQYASLWSQLATKYASVPNVVFDVMNEPHDLDVPTWAASVQAAVTAIRQAGATGQTILLPGTDFASAASFVSSGSAQALSAVTNLDGTTTNLVYNVHKYLDSDGSGTHANCVTNNIDTAFAPLAQYLRQNNRIAMLTETGGGPTDASCMQMLCQQIDFINQNSDVFAGVVTWAAGGFDTSYVITETPSVNGNTLTDQPLFTQCVASKIGGGNTTTPYSGPPLV